MKSLNRILRRLGEHEISRGRNLELVARIGDRYLKPYLGGSKELYARTVAQYQGMRHSRVGLQSVLRRAASYPLLAAFLLKNLLRGIRQKAAPAPEKVDGVKTGGEIPEYELPPELEGALIRSWPPGIGFLPWREASRAMGGLISVGCWEPEVHYKALLAMAGHAGIFRRYEPSFVLMYKEYDFVCSMLTQQFRDHGAEAYDVMHGDKAYFARDAFFAVDRYFVWHAKYGDMAREMQAGIGEVVVYTPDRLRPRVARAESSNDLFLLLPAYPVTPQVEQEWIQLVDSLKGQWRVKVRAHPRILCNPNLLEAVCRSGLSVSDPKEETAIEAIQGCRAVAGYHSTVLIEAYCQGFPTICLHDPRLDQLVEYHPFFSQEGLLKSRLQDLPERLTQLLGEGPAAPGATGSRA